MKQRAVVFLPGIPGFTKPMDYADASRFVGGYPDQMVYFLNGQEVIIYSASRRSECTGQAPNRIVDGRLIYGAMVVVGMTPLTAKQAQEIADSDVWMMAQRVSA